MEYYNLIFQMNQNTDEPIINEQYTNTIIKKQKNIQFIGTTKQGKSNELIQLLQKLNMMDKVVLFSNKH